MVAMKFHLRVCIAAKFEVTSQLPSRQASPSQARAMVCIPLITYSQCKTKLHRSSFFLNWEIILKYLQMHTAGASKVHTHVHNFPFQFSFYNTQTYIHTYRISHLTILCEASLACLACLELHMILTIFL